MLRVAVLLISILIGLAVIVFTNIYAVALGMSIIFLVTLILTLTNHDVIDRARWFFICFFVFTTGLLAVLLLQLLTTQTESDLTARLVSVLGAGIVSFLFTILFLLITVYMASIQILLSNKEEGLSVWHAFYSMLVLILGTHQEWKVISEGKEATTNSKGLLKFLGGPGKIIVDPGNAAVLQKGGKITRVIGPGVTLTKKVERIRKIFDLTNQFDVLTVENVITADLFPLTVELGVGYRIKRANNPDSPTALKDNKSRIVVEENTILDALFNTTLSGGWAGIGKGAPQVQLRDQIMGRKLSDLLKETGDPDERVIKKIEDVIKETLNRFIHNSGIEITGVDIRTIILPDAYLEAINIKRIETAKNEVAEDLLQGVFDRIRAQTHQISQGELDMAKAFVESLKLVEFKGAKVIRLGSANTPLEAPIETGGSED